MKIKDKHRKAAMLIVTGMGSGKVAKTLEVTPDCVTKWLNDEEFQKTLEFYRTKYHEIFIDDMKKTLSLIKDRLLKIIIDEKSKDSDAINASGKILEALGLKKLGITMTDPQEIEDKMEELYDRARSETDQETIQDKGINKEEKKSG